MLQIFSKTKKFNYKIFFCIILFFSIFTRLYRIHYPRVKYFDEVYHVPAAVLVANNNSKIYEWWHEPIAKAGNYFDWLHPPIAKYIQAASLRIFGNNPTAWRMPSAIFGVSVVLVSYIFANFLLKNKKAALYVMALISLDGLLLVQSRIAMNDIYFTLFALISIVVYWNFQKKNCVSIFFSWKLYLMKTVVISLFLGLSLATKWTGVLLILALFSFDFISIYFGLFNIKKKIKFFYSINILLQRLTTFFVIPILIYIASYLQIFLQGKEFNFLLQLHKEIIHYHLNRDANHTFASRPINWFLNNKAIWYWTDISTDKTINIYAFGNPVLHWIGIIAVLASIATCCFVFFLIIKQYLKKKKRNLKSINCVIKTWIKKSCDNTNLQLKDLFFLLWCYIWLWLPWIFSPRIMFYYHYTPAIPLLCMIIGWWLVFLKKKRNTKVFISLVSTAMIIAFFMNYKLWIGL